VLAGLRQFEHHRDLQRLAIEKDSVLVFAVIAEPFTMIGKKNDRGAIVDALLAEKKEKSANDGIRRGDIAIVRCAVL
jgi:hypothetical protein